MVSSFSLLTYSYLLVPKELVMDCNYSSVTAKTSPKHFVPEPGGQRSMGLAGEPENASLE